MHNLRNQPVLSKLPRLFARQQQPPQQQQQEGDESKQPRSSRFRAPRLLGLLVIAATLACLAVLNFLGGADVVALMVVQTSHHSPPHNEMIDCDLPTILPPNVQQAILRERASLSQPEPLDFRTVVDGNYLPRVAKSWPNGYRIEGEEARLCTPVLQRGHVVVYSPDEVREILAGRGRFAGRIRPFSPATPAPTFAQTSSSSATTNNATNNNSSSSRVEADGAETATGTATRGAFGTAPLSNNSSSHVTTDGADSALEASQQEQQQQQCATVLPSIPEAAAAFARPPVALPIDDGNGFESSSNADGRDGRLRSYTPVVLFADLGYGDEKSMYFENVASEWVWHTVFTPRDTNAFIAAIFFHRQNVTDAFNMDAAREYLRIPGVARAMTTYLIADRGVESCDAVQRLADVVQPHILIGTGDEKAARHCTAEILSQKCYGTDRDCGVGRCALPVTMSEFSSHGAPGVAHVPTWTWPRAEPRAMRRADAPVPPEGWVPFYSWPLPHGLAPWAEAFEDGFVCPRYETKYPRPPPAGVYTNENLRPLACYDLTNMDCLLAPRWKMPPRGSNLTCPPPPRASTLDEYYAFPPRHAHPFKVPPLERPRRLAWSLVGSRLYGDRNNALRAFRNAFDGIPSFVANRGFSRFDTLARVVCDSIFAPIGGGNCAYETARAYEVMRCGTIPVVATSAEWSSMLGASAVPDPASAYTTLLGFEGRWPDGWIVARTWPQAAAMARRALETPGEVARLRKLALASYSVLREAMHARMRLGLSRAAYPQHFWDEAIANQTLS